MHRILVLGGGVGGTLTANLVARRLRSEIDAGTATVTVVDNNGNHVYQPGGNYSEGRKITAKGDLLIYVD